MANSTIKQPSTNKPIEIGSFTKTADSSGCITIGNFAYVASLVITSPANAFAVRNNGDKVKIFKTTWNGAYGMFVLSELAQGDEVQGNYIGF